ncbi:hypothetical protein ACHAPQ_012390 [Fusarium lateritium]
METVSTNNVSSSEGLTIPAVEEIQTSTSTSSPTTRETPAPTATTSYAAMAKKNTSLISPTIVSQPVDKAEARFHSWWAAREKDFAFMTPEEHDAKFPKDNDIPRQHVPAGQAMEELKEEMEEWMLGWVLLGDELDCERD